MYELIDVTADGAVMLGPHVVCDGFIRNAAVRVQSHIHVDHMHEFSSSKGFQDIVCSEPTHQLLCALEDADLPFRVNFKSVQFGSEIVFQDCSVTLLPNDHMLGSVQVGVQLEDGTRVGYSGDFTWPMDEVMEVDGLVLDATYGNPGSVRQFSQGECELALVDLVSRSLGRGPVHIIAHRGTLQRAVQALAGTVESVIVGSSQQVLEAQVYRANGYAIGDILDVNSHEALEAMQSGRFIRVFGTGDKRPVEPGLVTSIVCSAYMTDPASPVMEYSDRAYRVALSNHADFEGTLEYVQATGAQHVVTDNARGPHGATLALEIVARLGIKARPSSNLYDPSWGH